VKPPKEDKKFLISKKDEKFEWILGATTENSMFSYHYFIFYPLPFVLVSCFSSFSPWELDVEDSDDASYQDRRRESARQQHDVDQGVQSERDGCEAREGMRN
jgi:hypothetical protein